MMQIVSEVKALDLGEGASATELVGFLYMEQTVSIDGWGSVVQTTLPYSIVILTLPCTPTEV